MEVAFFEHEWNINFMFDKRVIIPSETDATGTEGSENLALFTVWAEC